MFLLAEEAFSMLFDLVYTLLPMRELVFEYFDNVRDSLRVNVESLNPFSFL